MALSNYHTSPHTRFSTLIPIILFLLFPFLLVSPVSAQDTPFLTGWWTSITTPSLIGQYHAQGNTLLHAGSGGWFTSSQERNKIQTFLDEANRYNVKVILSLTRSKNTPSGIPIQEYIDTINAFKNHPALYAWYLGDEPEIHNNHDNDRSDDWVITHTILDTDPGYYHLTKQNDPNHPVFISFNTIYNPYDSYWDKIDNFFDVVDLVGVHSYPFWSLHSEFEGNDARKQYDVWKYTYEHTLALGKNDFIATAQGFGDGTTYPYRTPTYNEYRYQVFSAMVLGIDKILYWYDQWTEPNAQARVAQMITQTQQIGTEMNQGTTNDSRIGVSQTDKDKLTYRYGANGSRHIILAVNIANRSSSSGQTLENVKFTLPTGVHSTQVTVLDENRTLPVDSSNSFTDSFTKFQVHIYEFTSSSSPLPTPSASPSPSPSASPSPSPSISPSPSPSSCPADINRDNIVDIADYAILAQNFLKNPIVNSKADINKDNIVDLSDYALLAKYFLKPCP